MAFLVLGGVFLFVIPGVVLVILFSFALFEIVLHDVSPMQALRNSAGMVWKYFWPVLGRMIILMAVAMGIGLISDFLSQQQQPILSLVDLALNLGFSVFSTMYVVALYKNLRSVAEGISMTLTFPTILGVFGLLALILLISNLQTV